MYHTRTKHIEMQYHFVRENVLARDIDVVYVSNKEQVVDIFTKALGIEKLHNVQRLNWCVGIGFELEGVLRYQDQPHM